MIVGFEWLVDAKECNQDSLRDVETLRSIFARIISDLQLKTIGEGAWHKFDGEGGVTGLVMLTESHLACHTYPEHSTATFNLYCCRERPEWDWTENLKNLLGAKNVIIEKIERGSGQSQYSMIKSQIADLRADISSSQNDIVESKSQIAELRIKSFDLESQIQNPKSKIVGGEH